MVLAHPAMRRRAYDAIGWLYLEHGGRFSPRREIS
jgi:hypothetical protein